MERSLWYGVLLVGSLVGGLYFFIRSPLPDQNQVMVKPRVPELKKQTDQYISKAPPQKNLLSIPSLRGFQGSKINGSVQENENGEIAITVDLRRLFDYFFTMRKRYSQEEIFNQFKAFIESRLSEEAQIESLALFQNYWDYQNSLESYMDDLDRGDQDSLLDALEYRRNLRRELLGSEVADVFFSVEERYEDFQLALSEISQASHLNPQEKAEQIDELERSLPDEEYKKRIETFQFSRLKSNIQGLSTEESRDRIANRFGEEAAERFQAVQEKREEWEHRVEHYFKMKNDIYSSSLSEEEKTRQWEEFKEGNYPSLELKRLRALESIRSH